MDDFLREANRLETFGICKFSYIYSQFESENVADEILAALQQALHEWGNTMNVQPDAIIMICSAETPNAMTWLNNDELACFICDLPIPVLTGLGNTHGNTILDEVTHSQFETPIQVMNAIQQRVATRSTEARNNFELLLHNAAKKIKSAQLIVGVMEMTVKAEADRHLAQGKQSAIDLLATIHMDAQQEACATAQQSREMLQVLKDETMAHLSKAKLHVLSLWRPITQSAIQDSTSAELSKKVGVTRIKAMLNEISVDDIQYPDTVVSGTTEKYFQGESHDQPII